MGSTHILVPAGATAARDPQRGPVLVQLRPPPSPAPELPLTALDQLWFQVSGTVCNLRCRHCFISCSPGNHTFWFMSRTEVRAALQASVEHGVKEYYFTGGEPFMNREIVGILGDALELGPATVLTNATLLPPRRVEALAGIAAASPYSLELRVSLDGVTAEMNDALRGAGAFERAMGGVERLVGAGFLPIITCMRSWEDEETDDILGRFRELLAGIGYTRARLKILPPLLIGAEAERTHGYAPEERVTHEMLHGFDLDQLLCTRARLVTARGVYACPILLDSPSARLGDSLAEAAAAPARLAEQACYTCYRSGAICSNVPATGRDLQ
ncbi:MAG TPA: radical SAM protein [Longimicrobiaceae bacterium]|nr:radical SAM protein [Longimicrobiaceae bacterium]